MKHLLLTIALASSFAAPGFAGEAAHGNKSGDTHGEMKIGMPGDAAAVDRTVEIDMVETDDGEMLFKGGDLDFKEGDTVRFVVRNEGELDHEFILDSQKKNAAHKNEMADMSGMNMGHNEPNRIRLAPGEDAEIIWTFANNGTFEAACLIPGHYESGMFREVSVTH